MFKKCAPSLRAGSRGWVVVLVGGFLDVCLAARVWCDRNARPSSVVLVTVVVWGPRVVLVGQRLAHRVCNKCLDSLSAASGFSVDG